MSSWFSGNFQQSFDTIKNTIKDVFDEEGHDKHNAVNPRISSSMDKTIIHQKQDMVRANNDSSMKNQNDVCDVRGDKKLEIESTRQQQQKAFDPGAIKFIKDDEDIEQSVLQDTCNSYSDTLRYQWKNIEETDGESDMNRYKNCFLQSLQVINKLTQDKADVSKKVIDLEKCVQQLSDEILGLHDKNRKFEKDLTKIVFENEDSTFDEEDVERFETISEEHDELPRTQIGEDTLLADFEVYLNHHSVAPSVKLLSLLRKYNLSKDVLESDQVELDVEKVDSRVDEQTDYILNLEATIEKQRLQNEVRLEEASNVWNQEKIKVIEVLNEKSREISRLKFENANLLQSITEKNQENINCVSLPFESLKNVEKVDNMTQTFQFYDIRQQICAKSDVCPVRLRCYSESSVGVDLEEPLIFSSNDINSIHPMAYLDQEMLECRKSEKNYFCMDEIKRKMETHIQIQDVKIEELQKSLDDSKYELSILHANCQKIISEKDSLLDQISKFNIEMDEKTYDLELARKNVTQLTDLLDEKSNDFLKQQSQHQALLAEKQILIEDKDRLRSELDEISFSDKSKERELMELRREVSLLIDRKKKTDQELQRLKEHLVSVEDGYTKDALFTEQSEQHLRKLLQDTEDSLRLSNELNSSISSEAAQSIGALKSEKEKILMDRNKLQEKLTNVSNEFSLQSSSLENLQIVLESFQKERDNAIRMVKNEFQAKLDAGIKKQESLKDDIYRLQIQATSAQEGLAAAGRLGTQLERKSEQLNQLKSELHLCQVAKQKATEEATQASFGKVDRSLLKNLVIGYSVADSNNKPEVLRVIATVLDFNREERLRTGLEGVPSSKEGSLSLAFVKFLEEESKPLQPKKDERKTSTSHVSVSEPTLLVTSEQTSILPVFKTTSASSSILKNVLRE